MFLKDVLNKCKEKGYPVSASGLYFSGRKYGFLKRKEGSRNLDFDEAGFFEWLHKATEKIPEGWLPLSEVAKELGISLSQIYILIKDEDSKVRSFGAGKGVLYVEPERIKRIIRKREENHKEKWSR